MEKTATKTTKKSITKDQLKKAYIEHVLTEEKEPRSVFAFAKHNKLSEEEFYKHFNSLQVLERSIWTDWFSDVTDMLEKDDTYSTYSLREKVLAIYYSLFEKLKSNRSYAIYRFDHSKREPDPQFLKGMKEAFKEFVDRLVNEGKETGEVMERPFSNQYVKAFWIQFLFVARFWINDESEGFAKTDAAIEKSVNLAFDLIGNGPIDRVIDFAKFLIQNNQRPF
jgi:hypothetical protein